MGKLRLREYELFFQSYILEKLTQEILSLLLYIMPYLPCHCLSLFHREINTCRTVPFVLFTSNLLFANIIIRRTTWFIYCRVLSLMDPQHQCVHCPGPTYYKRDHMEDSLLLPAEAIPSQPAATWPPNSWAILAEINTTAFLICSCL